ncbi:hypothetical protein D3C76_1817240 [compost metagenome]
MISLANTLEACGRSREMRIFERMYALSTSFGSPSALNGVDACMIGAMMLSRTSR